MTPRPAPRAGVCVAVAITMGLEMVAAQGPVATFKSSIELVRISAVVRDRKGRFVEGLSARDFEMTDGGRPRPLTDLRQETAGLSVAMLFDISGSMQNTLSQAREGATHLMSWLEPDDEVAIFTFDTTLEEVTAFERGRRRLPEKMTGLIPFGATSLHDAIARTAERVGRREGRRGAVVVFTDGGDNASRLTPGEVSGIASAIDVPVYLFAAVPWIDNPSAGFPALESGSPLAGPLADLAAWTGGHVFVVSTPAARSAAARQIVDELRHQYVITFEPSGEPGWHPLVVRARNKDLVVRTRSGYIAGQSRPAWQ